MGVQLPGFERHVTPAGVPVLVRFEQNPRGRWVVTGLHVEATVDTSIDSQTLRRISLTAIEAEHNARKWNEGQAAVSSR